MTKEELEKEADKYADDYATPDLDSSFRAYMFEASKEGYLAGAEPRENQIAELSKHIVELQNDKGELIDRCRELEAQIKEMKSDVKANIKWADEHENNQMYFKLNSMFNQWEIKEND